MRRLSSLSAPRADELLEEKSLIIVQVGAVPGASVDDGVLGVASGGDHDMDTRVGENPLQQRRGPGRDAELLQSDVVGPGNRPPSAKGRMTITPRFSSAASGRMRRSTSRSNTL